MDRKRRLFLSLVMNFMTRIPSVAMIFIFLPALRRGLGIDGYGQILTSLAAGSVLAIPFGGFGQMTVRLIGEAHSREDDQTEADVFLSSAIVNLSCLGVLALASWLMLTFVVTSNLLLIVMVLPIAQAAANAIVDMTRLAYNEHFVTVTVIIVLQAVIYAAAFLIPAFTQDRFLAALIFVGPTLLASMIGAALLLKKRPHLAKGHPSHVRRIAWQGSSFSLADGLLISSLNVLTVWLGSVASGAVNAWFASVSRIFQMILNPVVLLVVPLAAYVRSIWNELDERQRHRLIWLTAAVCILCGIATMAVIAAMNEFYIVRVLHIDVGIKLTGLLPILGLLGVITAYKGFSSIAYLVLDSRQLVRGTILIFCFAFLVAAVSTLFLAPIDVVRLFCLLAAVPEAVLLAWIAQYHRRPTHAEARPEPSTAPLE